MAILEELKSKANGMADKANNIQEAISMMETGPFYVDATMFDPSTMTVGASNTRWADALKAYKSGRRIIARISQEVVPLLGHDIESEMICYDGSSMIGMVLSEDTIAMLGIMGPIDPDQPTTLVAMKLKQFS